MNKLNFENFGKPAKKISKIKFVQTGRRYLLHYGAGKYYYIDFDLKKKGHQKSYLSSGGGLDLHTCF